MRLAVTPQKSHEPASFAERLPGASLCALKILI